MFFEVLVNWVILTKLGNLPLVELQERLIRVPGFCLVMAGHKAGRGGDYIPYLLSCNKLQNTEQFRTPNRSF
jgi:hypothetical protein